MKKFNKSTIKSFMESTGYTNYTCTIGVRKDHKRNNDWNFKSVEQLLKDYNKYLNKLNKINTIEYCKRCS